MFNNTQHEYYIGCQTKIRYVIRLDKTLLYCSGFDLFLVLIFLINHY